ncbi:hypothetical protein HF521_001047 [Silurus meridionalis]|uniref:Uncharacterized protein n=1 Tax=Silurus meridionalis TaxID=175797 RepID=A0A8T0B9P2_SILME|nr:hypothetical protein HF521_001047 [Silurus meridionalis]
MIKPEGPQTGMILNKMQSTTVPLNVPLGDGRGAGTVVVSMPEHPPDYVVWSIVSLYYGNPLCLGLMALFFSMKCPSPPGEPKAPYHLFHLEHFITHCT